MAHADIDKIMKDCIERQVLLNDSLRALEAQLSKMYKSAKKLAKLLEANQ